MELELRMWVCLKEREGGNERKRGGGGRINSWSNDL